MRQAYDRAAICARGVKDARLNFPLSNYTAELESLHATPLDQLAATLRCACMALMLGHSPASSFSRGCASCGKRGRCRHAHQTSITGNKFVL